MLETRSDAGPHVDTDAVTTRPWVIIGCGYTGTRLARRLLGHGARVYATRRTPERVAELAMALPDLRARALDLATLAGGTDTRGTNAQAFAEWIPPAAFVVDCAPPGPSSPEADRALVRVIAGKQAHRLVYVSSTGVYPKCSGQWIDEDHPVEPQSRRGRARLAAECAVLDQARELGMDCVALRAVGIYGPGRGVHARLHAGTYRIIGAGDTFVNRVHVDDLGTAIIAAATIAVVPRTVFHVADDRPEKSRIYADAVAEIMGVPKAPSVPVAEVDPWIATMLGANRRIGNGRMKSELGVTLAYPTWREGLRQVLAEDGIAIPDAT